MNPEDFYTKPACNVAQRLPLYLPDGTDSGEWIEVYGIDSDAYDAAKKETQRQLLAVDVEISQLEKKMADRNLNNAITELQKLSDDRKRIIEGRVLATRAAIVSGWSFKKECTHEAVIELMKNAPLIADEVDRYATNRMNFISNQG